MELRVELGRSGTKLARTGTTSEKMWRFNVAYVEYVLIGALGAIVGVIIATVESKIIERRRKRERRNDKDKTV